MQIADCRFKIADLNQICNLKLQSAILHSSSLVYNKKARLKTTKVEPRHG